MNWPDTCKYRHNKNNSFLFLKPDEVERFFVQNYPLGNMAPSCKIYTTQPRMDLVLHPVTLSLVLYEFKPHTYFWRI